MRADKSEQAQSPQQQSRWRRVPTFEKQSCPANGAVSYRASVEVECSGLPRRLWSKRAFDAEQASCALVFEERVENSHARPHLPLSRLIHQAVLGHGALLRGYARQLLPPISISWHHQKLALPVEAVCARVRILFLRASHAPRFFFDLAGRGATSKPDQ
jgi:hypothetical protein